MEKIKLLVVDDLSIVREGIKHKIKKYNNIEIAAEFNDCMSAIKYLQENPNSVDVLLIDMDFSEKCNLDTIQAILKKDNRVNILTFMLNYEHSTVISLIKIGVLGYVLKRDDNELVRSIEEVANRNKYFSNKISVAMMDYVMDERGRKEDAVLSKREIEVLKIVANGSTNKETGEKLSISGRTVETHRKNILEKIGVKNTAEMIKYAYTNKILT